MRIRVLVALLVIPLAIAAPIDPVEITWIGDALGTGDIRVAGEGVIAMQWAPNSAAKLAITVAAPGSVVEHVEKRAEADADGVARAAHGVPLPSENYVLEPGSYVLEPAPGVAWTSLVARAKWDLVAPDSDFVVADPAPLSVPAKHRPPAGTYRDGALDMDGAHTFGISVAAGASPARLGGVELSHIELHGWTITCAATPCPRSGQPASTGAAPGNHEFAVHDEAYAIWTTPAATMALEGQPSWIGGLFTDASDLAWNGTIRFTSVSIANNAEPGMPFRGTGNASISDIRQDGSGNARTGILSGRLDAAAFGETPVPEEFFASPATVAAAIMAPFVLWKLAVLLRALARRDSARAPILAAIEASPGIAYRALMRDVGIGNGTLSWHLFVLEKQGSLTHRRLGNTKRYFAGPPPPDWAARIVAATDQGTAAILHWLAENGPSDQGRCVQAMTSTFGISRTAVQKHLKKLEEAGTIFSVRQGRRVVYAPTDAGLRQVEIIPVPVASRERAAAGIRAPS